MPDVSPYTNLNNISCFIVLHFQEMFMAGELERIFQSLEKIVTFVYMYLVIQYLLRVYVNKNALVCMY